MKCMKHLIRILASAFFIAGTTTFYAQTQTVGTFLNTPESFDGYTLLDPMGSTATHLINNCGEVVNSWSSDYPSGGACYLLEDGSLVRGCRVNGAFNGGGVGGLLERRSWDDELIWTLDWADDTYHHHHDFAWMPNGNVLILAWELKTTQEAAEAGRTNPQTMWPETITEIAPTPPSGGEIVWEWRAWDHLVQNTDSALAGFGIPSEFPRRIDVNFGAVGGGGGPGGANSGDWMHANAVNYNAELDQIAISSRRFNEMWVIDHGTTTEEATGPAGDLMYRFGNPQAYGRGTETDRLFFGQHDVQWIPEGHPQAGQFAIYNNGDSRPECLCSTVDTWMPPLLEDGTYDLVGSEPFGPALWNWSYPEQLSTSFFSANISGVHPQPNGNYLVCAGADGRLFEVTQEGQMVWEYINPEGNFGISPQGTNPQQNSVFRAYRYGPEFPGFEGRDLTPGEPLEGPSAFSCELYPATTDTVISGAILDSDILAPRLYPNPAKQDVRIWSPHDGTWVIRDSTGRILLRFQAAARETRELNCQSWSPGIYFATFQSKERFPGQATLHLLISP